MSTPAPLGAFSFSVQWGGTRIGFAQAAGLDKESRVIEYRGSATPGFSPTKMAGMHKFANVTLKRGVTADREFLSWLSTTKTGTARRHDLVISLLDEKHEPVMIWKLKNALPIKVEAPQLEASGNDVAIDSIELAHEGLELQDN